MGNLRDYIIRRILIAIPTLLGISVITFGIIHLAPGGPLNFMLETQYDVDPEMILYMKELLGLDKPIHEQYIIWLKNLLMGNIGKSYISQIPVAELIGHYWFQTLKLALTALFLSLSIAVPLGVISAVKKDSLFDNASRLFALLGVSLPWFWTGLMAIFIFSVRLDIFPVFGARTIGQEYASGFEAFKDQIMHLALPALVMAFGSTALTTRLVRSSMLDVLNQEYIMTARAKGVKERIVVYKHALKNALLPVITLVGLSIGFLLSGSTTLETIFAWPGLGRFVVLSTFHRDYPAIMAMTMIVSTMVVISSIITDIVYGLLDPRIRY
jgi:peptide/nickel transport system permease protein